MRWILSIFMKQLISSVMLWEKYNYQKLEYYLSNLTNQCYTTSNEIKIYSIMCKICVQFQFTIFLLTMSFLRQSFHLYFFLNIWYGLYFIHFYIDLCSSGNDIISHRCTFKINVDFWMHLVRAKCLFAQNFAYMYWTWRQNSTWYSNVILIIFSDDDRKEKVDASLDETKSVNSKPTLQVSCNYFQCLS